MSMTFPTPCKISTITATGGVNSIINLQVLFEHVHIDALKGFVYIEPPSSRNVQEGEKIEQVYRGKNPMIKSVTKKKKEPKRFDNQVTCIVSVNGINYANVKVFKNGRIQMTGLKFEEQGRAIIDCIIENIQEIYNRGFTNVVTSINTLMNIDYKIQLINSDFKMGIEIRRDRLNKLIQVKYQVLSSFEPCIYPGVKIQFFWNNKNKGCHTGICDCEGFCDGRGNSDCKKITIAVFQSGCIIITGAQTMKQINDAYIFICEAIQNHKTELQKSVILPFNTKN